MKFLISLFLRLAADDDILVSIIFRYGHIQRDVGERRLKSYSGRHIDIENEFLQGLLYFFNSQIIVTDKRGKQGVKIRKSLCSCRFSLQGIEEINNLTQGAAQMIGGLALYFAGNSLKALQE